MLGQIARILQRRRVMIAGGSLAVLLGAAAVLLAFPGSRGRLLAPLLAPLGLASTPPAPLRASGFVEADEVHVAPEIGGRIVVLPVAAGETVEAGALLARLDDTLLQARIEAARADLALAQANLALVQAGAAPAQVRSAEGALAQAQAARDGAYQAWQDLRALRENPQALDLQIAAARTQLRMAEAALAQATYLKDAATIANDRFYAAREQLPADGRLRAPVASGTLEEILPGLPPEVAEWLRGLTDEGTYTYGEWELEVSSAGYSLYRWVDAALPFEAHLLPNQWWQAWVGVNSAQAARDGARQALSQLLAVRENPRELNAQIDAAESAYRAAEGTVEAAEAQVAGLRAGATTAEIAIVEAEVGRAEAALDALLVVTQKMVLTAPVAGQVLSHDAQVGELAPAGVTLLTLADLDEVSVTVYVPAGRMDEVQIGQRGLVRVDSFPGRAFAGTVATIADEASFVPRNVRTHEDRVSMVFAIKLRVPNPGHALKPGMPAEVLFDPLP